MTSKAREKQTTALVALLKALPDAQLIDVLTGVGAELVVPLTSSGPRHRGKPCGICGLIYPQHIARWGDDHVFEVSVSGVNA